MIIKAALIGEKIETFPIEVTIQNKEKVQRKLELERKKIINRLKQYKSEEQIKSIFRPKNKKIQDELDELVNVKREIKRSINLIKKILK